MTDSLPIVRSVADLRRIVGDWRAAGASIGLVPTMGALHEGHLTLVRTAAERCARTVVSLFVNPTQFNDPADLERYPRREAEDAAVLSRAGANLLFAPTVNEMYPDGFATTVSLSGPAEGLEGAHRPGHFEGVATVVSKLLLQSLPDVAFFGEKDYQQLQVITRMAADLNIPSTIEGVETVREADGLAMSSRNERMTEAERQIAPVFAQVLREVASRAVTGEPVAGAIAKAEAALLDAGFRSVDYVAVCHAASLAPLDRVPPGTPARVLGAAHLGEVRLIDNVAVVDG